MSPLILMILTGLAAGALIPITAIVAARLGICDPFSLRFGGHTWTFSKTHHTVASNTFVRFETHMVVSGSYDDGPARSQASVFTYKIAA